MAFKVKLVLHILFMGNAVILGTVMGQCDLPLQDYCKDDKVQMLLWCADHCVSEWSSWSSCNSMCGKGYMTRTRQTANTQLCSMFPDFSCSLTLTDTQTCNAGCPFGGLAAEGICYSCPNGRHGYCCETEVYCDYPESPANGRVSGNWPAGPGSVAEFTCNVGFTLQGSKSAICQTSGTWSSPTPLCVNETDYCASNPCVGGRCNNLADSYSCTCLRGCTGTNCDTGCERVQGSYGDYVIVTGTTLPRVEAAEACYNVGMQPLNLQTSEKFNEVSALLTPFSALHFIWTGGQLSVPGQWGSNLTDWMWSDGTILTYDGWCDGEPNHSGEENYITFNSKEAVPCLNDDNADGLMTYLCEA